MAYENILDRDFLAKLNLETTAARYEERFALGVPTDRTTLATLNEMIVGYCVCGHKVDAPCLGEPFMYALYVDPEVQGRGIGTNLLNEALVWARSVGGTRLLFGVFQANTAAIGFYRRHGASVVYSQPYEIDGKSYPTDYCEIPIPN